MSGKWSLEGKSDSEVVGNLKRLVEEEERNRAVLAALVAEMEERELFREAGYASIEEYCEMEIGLTKEELFQSATRVNASEGVNRG